MFDLLADELVRVDLKGGKRAVLTLPEVYQSMIADDVIAFPALRPHQRHGWHAFLAQLGTVAMVRAGREELPRSADSWRRLLGGLTPQSSEGEAWSLVADDPETPAFMQCPSPTGLADYRKVLAAADDLDLLVNAKNHDVKASVAVDGNVDDWIFSLINIQTMGGFGGAGNYGVARMNGGFSSRPCLGLAPADGGAGAHLAHDIRRMVANRDNLIQSIDEEYFDPDDGVALLWLEPWDGTSSLNLGELDPYFIEVCRRIRLAWRDGRIVARTASSKKPRVAAKHARGNLGDHWTPIARSEGKAFSISRVGFRYDRLAEMVLDDKQYLHPPAMKVDATAGRSWRLVARGVAAGQGKTEGYHERSDIVLRPPVARTLMGLGAARDRLGELSQDQLAEIQTVAKALRFAIAVAASGGKDTSDIGSADREKAYPYLRRLDATADLHFFRSLQERFEASERAHPAGGREFTQLLVDRANSLLQEAIETVPCPQIRRYRARARATSAFWGSLGRSDMLDHPRLSKTTN